MKRTSSIAAIALAVLFYTPGFALAASPLRLECSTEQNLRARALVCEYSMLSRLNAQLADLHEKMLADRKVDGIDLKRWQKARDACNDVGCLDELLQAGIRDARLVLVAVESREPAPVMANARGVAIRLQSSRPSSRPVAAEEPASLRPQARSLREPTGLEPVVSVLTVLFLAGVAVYAVVVRRLA